AGLVGAGAALLLPATVGPAVYVAGALADPARFSTFKPTWLLARELEADFAPATRDAAFAEIDDRLLDGELSPAALDAIAERALARQADTARAWSPAWVRMFERVTTSAPRAAEQRARFARQQWVLQLEVLPRVLHGGSIALRIRQVPRYGSRPWSPPDMRVTKFAIGPVEHRPAGGSEVVERDPRGFVASRDVVIPLSDSEWARLPVGSVHEVRLTVDLFNQAVAPAYNPATHTLLAAEPVRICTPVPLRTDPALREAVAVAVGVRRIQVSEARRGDPPGFRVSMPFVVTRAPVGVAWAVSLRAGDSEWPVGIVHFRPGVPGTMLAEGMLPPDFTLTRADVVLRPSQSAAARNADLAEIWGEPVVLADREVTWDQRHTVLPSGAVTSTLIGPHATMRPAARHNGATP
ncbi:MAG: hypothetical protein AVDCRST_MAG64-2758, partial [uncultured Phycisphaerae bacterium]